MKTIISILFLTCLKLNSQLTFHTADSMHCFFKSGNWKLERIKYFEYNNQSQILKDSTLDFNDLDTIIYTTQINYNDLNQLLTIETFDSDINRKRILLFKDTFMYTNNLLDSSFSLSTNSTNNMLEISSRSKHFVDTNNQEDSSYSLKNDGKTRSITFKNYFNGKLIRITRFNIHENTKEKILALDIFYSYNTLNKIEDIHTYIYNENGLVSGENKTLYYYELSNQYLEKIEYLTLNGFIWQLKSYCNTFDRKTNGTYNTIGEQYSLINSNNKLRLDGNISSSTFTWSIYNLDGKLIYQKLSSLPEISLPIEFQSSFFITKIETKEREPLIFKSIGKF